MDNLEFIIGDQIVYIPSHAENKYHPDAEFGFITGFNPEGNPFCRYWNKYDIEYLRTIANSECTPLNMIERFDLKPQKIIDKLLIELGYREEVTNE